MNTSMGPRIQDIYLLIGQSNMGGRAPIEEQDRPAIPGAFLLDEAGGWVPASNEPFGLNRYSSVAPTQSRSGLGPGYSFAQTLTTAVDQPIGLVVNSQGGTAIAHWRQKEPRDGLPLYAEAVRRAQQALRSTPGARLRGIVWHQGESDNNADAAEYYMPELEKIVSGLRRDLSSPQAVLVAGEVGTWQGRGAHINPVIRTVSEHITGSTWVSSDGLTTHETDTEAWGPHFDSASQRVLGTRYGEAMLGLL